MSNASRRRHHARAALFTALATAGTLAITPMANAAVDGSNVIISEVYGGGGNNNSVFNNDFVELYNPTDEPIDVTGWVINQKSASGNTGGSHTLDGEVPANGYYLVQGASGNNSPGPLPTPDETGSSLGFSGTEATAELRDATGIVDLVGWGGASQFEEAPAGRTSNSTSVQRDPVDVDTDNNADDFIVDTPTPQNSGNEGGGSTPGEPGEPVEPGEIIPIADIQGTGDTTPFRGQTVTTEGVVTAVYDEGGMNGFYLQTAGTGGETQEAGDASHGIFVYLGGTASNYPEINDSLVVTGTAEEYYGTTQLTGPSFSPAEAELDPVAPVEIEALPLGDEAREAYEGMLLQPTGAHTVTNNYTLNTFGEIGLAPGTEAFRTPTDIVLPGQAAQELQAQNDAELITLDDGRTRNYMQSDTDTPLPYIAVDGEPGQSLRTGDQVSFENPVVLDFDHDLWRFQPTTPITGENSAEELPIAWENSRPAALAEVDTVAGDYTLASFNVLNYFTSLGEDENNCDAYEDRFGNPVATNYCTVRGAYTPEAFDDQQTKIVTAINMLDVDVLGLEEIENSAAVHNDPSRRDEALEILVDALNEDAGEERWAFVPSPSEVGTDEDVIRVGFIYNPSTVEMVGESRIFDDPAYTGTARQPLAQEFQPLDGGESFVAVTNHLKSKGSVVRGDGDQGDGQGNNANVRNDQVEAMLEHLDEQTDWADAPIFILGDINAYSREDAIRTLEANGYTNINTAHAGHEPTYQFAGQLGSLDHAFGNEAAMELVDDALVWNINADEPIAYEYSRRNYNAVDFHDESPFRSSDHDPIKVGFSLDTDEAALNPVNTEATVTPGQAFEVPLAEGADPAADVTVEGLPEGWNFEYADGTLTVTAPENAADGDVAEFTVTQAGETVATVELTVVASDAITVVRSYLDEDGNTVVEFSDGTTITIPAGQDGESITVESTTIDEDGNTVVEFSDGTTITIPAGRDGESITVEDSYLDEDGNTIVEFSDGTSITIPAGQDGSTGGSGRPGSDGESITVEDSYLDEDGNTIVEFSDGTSITIPAGQDGSDGADGEDGTDGSSEGGILGVILGLGVIGALVAAVLSFFAPGLLF